MKILHITPSTNGYEEVILLANRISETNRLALIEKNGKKYMTGGILLEDCPEIRSVLDAMPKEKQHGFALKFKCEPFVLSYATEDM